MLFLPLGLIVAPFDRRHRVYDFLSRLWARTMLRCLGVILTVSGTSDLRRGCYVVVSNHQSLLDTLILLAVLQPTLSLRFVAKGSLFRVPLLGWGMAAYGHVALDRGGNRQMLAQMQRAESHLQKFSIVWFPEGSRTTDGQLQSFQRGAFRMACRTQTPALPITIDGSSQALPRDSLVIRPQAIKVHVHPVITPSGNGPTCERDLTDAVHAAIASGLRENPRD